jgi:acetyl-CoA acyltransferase
MKSVVISAYARTAFTPAYKGALATIRPDEMAGQLIKGLVASTGIAPADIEDLLMGCAFPEGEQGLNIARLVVFLAGLPISVGGATLNRFCGSSMQAVHSAAGAIACGAGDVFICAGVESMTRIPMGGFNPSPHPGLFESYAAAYESMGITAENLARTYHITRQEQEAFALSSHHKAAAAEAAMRAEILPILSRDGTEITSDGCIRAASTAESLAALPLAFDTRGTVTAGTSSPLTDGASALILCAEDYADHHHLPKLARIKSMAIAGCDPDIMGIGPVAATRKALTRAGLQSHQLDIIELNEAFAAQSLACIRDLELDLTRINLDGGALALGHPLGATGARITGKAASLLKREGKHYALATQCIGGGQGIATILERI